MQERYMCKNKKDYDALIEHLEKKGYSWADGIRLSVRNIYDELETPFTIRLAIDDDKKYILFDNQHYIKCKEIKENICENPIFSVPDYYKIPGIANSFDTALKITEHNARNIAEGVLLFNLLSYLFRYGHKDGTNDLKKAKDYLDRLICHNESEKMD